MYLGIGTPNKAHTASACILIVSLCMVYGGIFGIHANAHSSHTHGYVIYQTNCEPIKIISSDLLKC